MTPASASASTATGAQYGYPTPAPYDVKTSADSRFVSQFAVGADGSLTALAAAGPVTGGYLSALAFSPDGTWFYVSSMDGRFYRFARAADGSLTLVNEVNEGPTYKLWRIEVR